MECPLCCAPFTPNHLSHCVRRWLQFQRLSTLKIQWPWIHAPRCPAFSDPEARKATFAPWLPNQKPSVDALVQNGFYYTGEGDMVTCFWCKGRIGYWTVEDDPLERHVKQAPECSFAWFKCEEFCNQQSRYPLAKEIPYHIKMVEASRRLESFKEWSLEPFVRKKRPSKDNLVQGGFFSIEEDLLIRCFWCNLEMDYRWFHSENSVEQHLKMKPDCLFAKNVSLRAEVMDDQLLCKICVTNELEITFLNCGHVASCQACSKQLTNCPICRQCIVKKLRIYMS